MPEVVLAAAFVLLDPLLDPLVEASLDVEGLLDLLSGDLPPEEDDELDDSDASDGRGLESVTYQPEPLKMMPAG